MFYQLLRGTLETIFRIGREGSSSIQVKNDSGAAEMRNDDDSAYIITRGLDPVGAQDYVTKTYGDSNYLDAESGGLRVIRFAIALVDVSSVTALPAGAIVFQTSVNITTPYSAGATIAIGDTGGTVDLYMGTTENVPQTANLYGKRQETTGVATTVEATIGGAPAAGAGFVTVWYAVPNA